MNKDEKIAKGRSLLKMKVAMRYKQECSDPDLLKIPLEGLHSIALQQIGEQESYIQELEEKVAFLEKELANKEEKAVLTRNEKKKIAREVSRRGVCLGQGSKLKLDRRQCLRSWGLGQASRQSWASSLSQGL